MGQVGPWMPVRPSSRFSGVFLMVRELHHEIDLTACKVLPIRRRAGSWSYFFERFACGMLAVVVLLIAARQSYAESFCGADVIAHPDAKYAGHSLGMTGDPMAHKDGRMHHIPTPCERGMCHAPTQMPLLPPSVPVPQSFDQLLLQLSSVAGFSPDARLLIAANSADPLPGFQRRLRAPAAISGNRLTAASLRCPNRRNMDALQCGQRDTCVKPCLGVRVVFRSPHDSPGRMKHAVGSENRILLGM